ncbi:MAG: FAD-dependent oxidoreductase [Flavobacteriales bacterium]|nr:FAD-dependent oxidoreductase [Flavobacteriales bacterium]
MKPTNIKDPEYFHKVVDCQYACPAHTPVPEYIRMIAAGRYDDAYMINWESNVFPGILGRVCDRPCEPACRRGRVEDEPVAICRLKRVAADNKDNIKDRLPTIAAKNGKKVALIGAGPASLTVARGLAPLGYQVDLFDEQDIGGGFMRNQIPSFRLPIEVLNEEVNYILDMGINTHFKHYVDSLKDLVEKDYDAIFVGSGAPNGRDLELPGRQEGDANIKVGINWLDSVAFEHIKSIGKNVIVLGGGNTAMDCCRTARRLGGTNVKIVVRSPRSDMKASPWEIEDAVGEDIPIFENHTPKEFVIENGKLKGMHFEKVRAEYDKNGKRSLIPTGEDLVFMPADQVLIAIGQDNAYPWIERDIGIEFGKWDMPVVDKVTFQSTNKKVFFGGDAAFGPSNIITAVADGHKAAISIHKFCNNEDVNDRPAPGVNLLSQKMGFHEWTYDNEIDHEKRHLVPHVDKATAIKNLKMEVEKGFDQDLGYEEAMRCFNCDVQTVFTDDLCIECDACADVCPTNCINFIDNGDEDDLRTRLLAPANDLGQDLYVSGELKTSRVMVKDENVCLHCGLCAERCPTAAWDMSKFTYAVTKAGN